MQFARRHHYRPLKRAVRRRQKRRFIPTVTTPIGENIDGLFCVSLSSQSDFTTFISNFNIVISSPLNLTASELNQLDYYNDGTVGYDDRDYWLDQLLRRNLGAQSRLSYGQATPTTYAESDPLGLRFKTDGVTLRPNVIFLDSTNTSKVYVNESSNNDCYANEARTGGSTTLFDSSTSQGQYRSTNMVWGDLRSLNENGGNNRRRFPGDGEEVTIYVRGGDYTLDREIIMQRTQTGSQDQSRIIIRNYPGEVVNWYCGNQENSPTSFDNTVELTVQRPRVKWRGHIVNGYRIRSGTDRVFSPLLFSFPNAAQGWEMSDCTIQNFRCIADDHADAGRLPHYVDFAFYFRSAAAADLTEKALDSSGILVGRDAYGLLQDCKFYPAGDDFPLNSATWDRGECVDLSQSVGVTIRRCDFDGPQGHFHIRLLENAPLVCDSITIEDCFIRNPNNSCVGFQATNSTFRRNRVADWSSMTGASDGTGMQIAWMESCTITDNVFYLGDSQGSGQNYGIDIGKFQGLDDYEVIGNTISGNVFFRSGMSFGCNSSPPSDPDDIARVTSNTISGNVFYGQSDASHSYPGGYYDAPITINMGTHQTNMGGNTFSGNQFFRDDGDKTVVAERLPGSLVTDYKITDNGTWFTSNVYANPMFADPENGDFTLDYGSAADALLSSDIPLHPDDLQEPFGYMCPTEFSTATFDYTLRHKQGRLDLGMPALAPQLLGKRI